MEEAIAARYWCHMCSQMVNPIMGEEMKCPFCQSGFIEEMDGTPRDNPEADSEFGPDRPLSLWAPILMGMMSNPRRRRRLRRQEFDEEEDEDNENDDVHGGDTELDRELESIIRRRRRSSSTILQLLRGIRAAGLASESDNSETDRDRDRDRDRERERERLILINPFNQTIILHGSYDSSQGQNNNHTPIGSLGDYFIGPGLDLLLQHLAENDPNRYGTPPAKKEAVEGLPTVTVKENLQCSVCLDDLEIGVEAKEMPCKHKFHGECILPWLELHSSCPVCRFLLPADEAKCDSNNSRNSSNQSDGENIEGDGEEGDVDGDGIGRNGSGRRFQIPWPFNLFSSTESQTSGSGGNSSSSANATGSGNGSASSQPDDN